MTTVLSPVLVQSFKDNNGSPLFGGQLFSYQAGTTTPQATYTDSSGGTPNANPTILNARGEANIWIPPNTAYKFVLEDSAGNTIWSVDQVVSSQLLTLYGGVDTGIANAYVLTFTASFSAYADGIVIYWIPSHSNTGASTINVNGLGVVSITNQDGSALKINQLIANQVVGILYKGGKFILLNVSATSLSPTINTQNATYTFALSDANNVVMHTDASAYTWTIPPTSSAAFSIGTSIEIVNQGTGTITVSPGVGVTFYPFGGGTLVSGSVTLPAASSCFILKTGSDTWQQSTQTEVIYQLNAYTATLNGVTAAVTGSVLYRQTGHLVTLYVTSALTGISNSTGTSISGMPVSIRPVATQVVTSVNMEDNGATIGGTASIATSGVVTFGTGINGNTAGFTASGTKGLQAGWSVTYSVV